MTELKIFIDSQYPRAFIEAIERIHALQREKRFEIVRWATYTPDSSEIPSSIFLLLDNSRKGVEVTTLKHFEEGYRVVACRMGTAGKKDFFELSMTLFRVWPYIMEKATNVQSPFLYTVKYGGKRLKRHAVMP